MRQISVSLAEVDLRNVDVVATYDSVSRSEVIRRAVFHYFANRATESMACSTPTGSYVLMDELMKGFGEDSLAPWQRSNR